jgi:hypothetical protein
VPTLEDPQDPHDPQPGEADPFEGLVLDEDFVRGATQKEGSARARMLATAWRQQPPGDTSWRPAPTGARRWYRRRPPKAVAATRRSRVAGRWQAPLFVLLAVALVVIALNPSGATTWVAQHLGGKAPGAARPQTAAPTPQPLEGLGPQLPDVAQPFADSPAATWADGASGIVLPAPHPVGAFSRAQVGADLTLVRSYLADAFLDPAALAGGYPQSAVDALDSKQASWLRQALAHPSFDNDPMDWVSRFDPRSAILASPTVKVQGTVSISADGHNGLLVSTDFVFVYALRQGPHTGPTPSAIPSAAGTAGAASWVQAVSGATPIQRTIARRSLGFDFYDPARYQVEPGKVFIRTAASSTGNDMCGVSDGYLNPYFEDSPDGASGAPTPSGPAVDPYAHASPLPDTTNPCGRDSQD